MESKRNESPGKGKMMSIAPKTMIRKLSTHPFIGAVVLLLPWYPSALSAESGHGASASAPATPAAASAPTTAATTAATAAATAAPPTAESMATKRGKNCGNRFCFRRILAPDLTSPLEDGTQPIIPCISSSSNQWSYSSYRYSLVVVFASWNLASETLVSILEPEIAELSRRSIGIFALASHDSMSALKGIAPEPIKGADAEFFEPEPEPDSVKPQKREERRRNWCQLNRANMRVGLVTKALENLRTPSASRFLKKTDDQAIVRTIWGKNPKVPTVWMVDSRGQLLDEIALPTREEFTEVIARLKLWTDF